MGSSPTASFRKETVMIGWVVSGLVIIAMALMTHKNRMCFIVFIMANIAWYIDLLFLQSPIQWSYVALVTIYAIFNTYGWFNWGKNPKVTEYRS